MTVEGTFEWLCDGPSLREIPRGGAALVLGCGTSMLSGFLSTRFDRVCSMDRDAAVVAEMRKREPALEWRVGTFATFEWRADAVFDKSTLDAWLAEQGHVADLVRCAHRCLRPGGKYVVVSLYPAAFVDALTGGFELVTTYRVKYATVCIFERVDYDFRDEASRQLAVVDDYFVKEKPFLTLERETQLRASFTTPLSVRDAYLTIFSEEERRVYEQSDFEHDLGNKNTLTLDEALNFLATAS